MAIKVQLQTEDAVEYVPDIQDNREKAAAGEPYFSATLMPMSGADYDKMHSGFFGGKTVRSGQMHTKAQKFIQRLVALRVTEVQGFALEQPGAPDIVPTNGAQLYSAIKKAGASLESLLDEIIEAIKDTSVLDEGTLGKLQAQSDSSAPETHPNETGDASSAGETSTTLSQPIEISKLSVS